MKEGHATWKEVPTVVLNTNVLLVDGAALRAM